jgi:NTE family protein
MPNRYRLAKRGLVIGCGGPIGFTWTVAALAALEEALGWDPRTADVLVGTSAGAEIAAALGSGRSVSDLLAALERRPGADGVLAKHLAYDAGRAPRLPVPTLPAIGLTLAALRGRTSAYSGVAGLLPTGRGDAGWLREYGEALSGPDGWVEHPATWIVAADARTGERVALGSDRAPRTSLGEAVAASWAIPGMFPPVEIHGRRYLDGGAVSPTSADLLATYGLDEVVVVAPMTTRGGAAGTGLSRVERVLRRQMTAQLDKEHRALADNGVRVIRIEPGADDLAAMGPNFMDVRRREATLATALRTSRTRVAEAIDFSRREGATR